MKEFKNHHKLSHKNIIKVYELYIDVFTRKIYTIMELTEGKEMFEVIINMGHYSGNSGNISSIVNIFV